MLALSRSMASLDLRWISWICWRVAIRASSNRAISRGISSSAMSRSTTRTSSVVSRNAGPLTTPGDTPMPCADTSSFRVSVMASQSS